MTVLEALGRPGGAAQSDRAIGRFCSVSYVFARKVRRQLHQQQAAAEAPTAAAMALPPGRSGGRGRADVGDGCQYLGTKG
jgi:hypothetical protein